MAAWVIRGGTESQYEKPAIETGQFTTGWNNLGDLSKQSRDELKALLCESDPTAKPGRIRVQAAQLRYFVRGIKVDDLVVMPRRMKPGSVAIGTIASDYQYQPDNPVSPHLRTVEWVNTEFPRELLRADIENSLRSELTIFRINHPNAEEYLRLAALPGMAEYIETVIENYLRKNYPQLTSE